MFDPTGLADTVDESGACDETCDEVPPFTVSGSSDPKRELGWIQPCRDIGCEVQLSEDGVIWLYGLRVYLAPDGTLRIGVNYNKAKTSKTSKSSASGKSNPPSLPFDPKTAERIATAISDYEAGVVHYPGHDFEEFINYKHDLPDKPAGYYTRYTVGDYKLGSERLVFGLGGEIYYSNYHYEAGSWVRIR